MQHIAIEGMDGVGKTTASKLLAKRLGYKFIDKNLRELFDDNDSYDNYIRIRDKVNATDCLQLGFMRSETFTCIPLTRRKIS